MEISSHDLWTVLHGMGFGALFMLAFSGALAELYRMSTPGVPGQPTRRELNTSVINALAFVGLAVGLLLTFPPFMDFLQGR